HPSEHARWRGRGANGSGRPVLALGAVGGAEAAEPVPLHGAREPLALRHTHDVGALARREDVDGDLLPGRVRRSVVGTKLNEVSKRLLDPGLVEVTRCGLVGLALSRLGIGQLDGRVAVGLRRLHLCHHARTGLDDRHRRRTRVLGEDLGHAELRAEDPLRLAHRLRTVPVPRPYSLISMSTPADSVSRCSSCTVFEVASVMSISRLWVSIWKCSRLSLSLWGPRITV